MTDSDLKRQQADQGRRHLRKHIIISLAHQ